MDIAQFEVRAGEAVFLHGPSGCGKSTLLSLLAGVLVAGSGQVSLLGQDWAAMGGSARDRCRVAHVGYIFQQFNLLPYLSVMDNVLFPIRTQKRVLAEHRPEAERLLKLTGLWDFRDKRPAELSGGMRQRVAICRGLVNDPRLLMMDEPFSALDAITRDDMNLMLAQLWDQVHKTAVFITHSIREAVFLSDRVLVMNARPSRIVADIRVPFERPRRAQMQEHPLFNEICAFVREKIHEGHDSRRAESR